MKPFVIPASVVPVVKPAAAASARRGKSASKRQAEVAQRIVRKGGKRTSIAYSAQALEDLGVVMAREGLETEQAAVHAALRAFVLRK